jgi:dCMP deaminase
MIINSGIKKIYYFNDYPDSLALELLNEAGVELIKLDIKI